ncbi:hypothetical protein F0562_012004 [Nyssa sinensis]|uniref:Uncharacterized protein n=1 Tax=Nyssa sinensis TaxID=561372 RepID=A0A5J4ZW26_9ASTE|nr:hypothetical protein F0562_012004 [Nyssa sinensis]
MNNEDEAVVVILVIHDGQQIYIFGRRQRINCRYRSNRDTKGLMILLVRPMVTAVDEVAMRTLVTAIDEASMRTMVMMSKNCGDVGDAATVRGIETTEDGSIRSVSRRPGYFQQRLMLMIADDGGC